MLLCKVPSDKADHLNYKKPCLDNITIFILLICLNYSSISQDNLHPKLTLPAAQYSSLSVRNLLGERKKEHIFV